MDANETSAMTEASGLNSEWDNLGTPSRDTTGTTKQTGLRVSAEQLAERLRKVAMEAPLRSLLAAFVLGIWFARRR